jgi:MFS family permease
MYMGWYTMTFSLAAVIAPAVGGAVYQYEQNLVWYLSLIAGVLVLIGFYALHARLRLT